MMLPSFDPPAGWNDFAGDPVRERAFRDTWNKSVIRWTENAILGNPWSVAYDHDRQYYFNPLTTDVPDDATSKLIPWTAFPNRLLHTFPNASKQEQWRYADDGPPQGNPPYRPVGPRGWQDEYCEWSVTHNAEGAITRVSFTCENPEYWFALWSVSPERVLALYRQLVSQEVQLEDLYLRDAKGNPVIERETGRPAYDALNKWNNSTTNGVVHLISPPNTLGAEIYLAAAATLLRERNGDPITDRDALIACSRYGTAFRNSDPFIGASVNELVRTLGVRVTLKNPVGLYIQTPDFSRFALPLTAPQGVQPSDFWKLVRGRPGFGLHAVFEVPPELGFTVSDITIDGFPIQYGSQLTQTFQIALTGVVVASTLPPPQAQPCQAPDMNPTPSPQALQDMNLYAANSRSTLTPRVEQGSLVTSLVLLAGDVRKGATVTFSGQGINAEVVGFEPAGDGNMLLQLSLHVAPDAPLGDRSLTLRNPDGTQGPAAPGMLEVVPAGSLSSLAPLKSLAALRGGASKGADTLTHGLAARLRPR